MSNIGENSYSRFVDILTSFIDTVSKRLPDDVIDRLAEMRNNETKPAARAIYDCMFENLDKATALNRPICQDTGLVQAFVRVGTKFPLIDYINEAITEAVGRATELAPLRHNAVNTFDEINTGNNLGIRAPWIEIELIPNSSTFEGDFYLAGGGCSLPGRATVMMPSAGYEGIAKFVFDTAVEFGINACPPLIVGVGVSTCVSSAAKLSKKAALRRVGTSNANAKAAEMEKRLAKGLNEIGLGPQGLSGTESVLCVNIENSARHPSSMGVGVSFGCWAHRRGTISIDESLAYRYLSHKEGR